MNIFYLDENPRLCAQYHTDKHVVKMILEYAQIMSTVQRQYTSPECADHRWYKSTHTKHPCTIWTGESVYNYLYLYDLWIELCTEYQYRYGRTHLTETKLRGLLSTPPCTLPLCDMTPMAQAMPEECKRKYAVDAYRCYYNMHKSHMFSWKSRNRPEWAVEDYKLV